MSEGSGPASSGGDEYDVLQYLAALETRRTAPSGFPEPEGLVDNLATAEMGKLADDAEELRQQFGAQTPGAEANVERLEEGFIAGAREYARRHGVRYESWINAGVDPPVLERAGIRPDDD